MGSAENSAINGADVTVTFPGGVQQDDLVIVAYAIGDNDSVNFDMAIVSPTGYTEVADLFADDAQDTNLGVFWKIMGATPDTSVTVDGLGGADAAVAAVVMIFRGVDTTTPMDVTPTTATAIDTMHPNPPSIDHLNPTGLWTVIAGASGTTLIIANTENPYTMPTGYVTDNIQRAETDTSDISIGMGYRTNPADPEDPGVMTHSGTDNVAFSWCAATLALRPAPELVPVRSTAGELVLDYLIPVRATAGELVLDYLIPVRTTAGEIVLDYVIPVRTTAGEIFLDYIVGAASPPEAAPGGIWLDLKRTPVFQVTGQFGLQKKARAYQLAKGRVQGFEVLEVQLSASLQRNVKAEVQRAERIQRDTGTIAEAKASIKKRF